MAGAQHIVGAVILQRTHRSATWLGPDVRDGPYHADRTLSRLEEARPRPPGRVGVLQATVAGSEWRHTCSRSINSAGPTGGTQSRTLQLHDLVEDRGVSRSSAGLRLAASSGLIPDVRGRIRMVAHP